MSGPILFDSRGPSFFTVWHEDPKLEALINDIMEAVKPDRFVETGTHMGWTLMYMARRYPSLPIYSVEIDDQYHAASLHNCKPYRNMNLYHMSSPDFLTLNFNLFNHGLSLFWLDAHWQDYVPLRDECKIVATLDRYVCLLDDFACDNPRFSGEVFGEHKNNLQYVADIMGKKCYRPNYKSLPLSKGYGLFIKGVYYQPPKFMKEDSLE